jgi:hypothetical protein
MTRDTNRRFIRAGLAGVLCLPLLAGIGGAANYLNISNDYLEKFVSLSVAPLVLFSFICLVFFGIMPRALSLMFGSQQNFKQVPGAYSDHLDYLKQYNRFRGWSLWLEDSPSHKKDREI